MTHKHVFGVAVALFTLFQLATAFYAYAKLNDLSALVTSVQTVQAAHENVLNTHGAIFLLSGIPELTPEGKVLTVYNVKTGQNQPITQQ